MGLGYRQAVTAGNSPVIFGPAVRSRSSCFANKLQKDLVNEVLKKTADAIADDGAYVPSTFKLENDSCGHCFIHVPDDNIATKEHNKQVEEQYRVGPGEEQGPKEVTLDELKKDNDAKFPDGFVSNYNLEEDKLKVVDSLKAYAPKTEDELQKDEQIQEAKEDKFAERASDNKTKEGIQESGEGTTKVEGDSPLTASKETAGAKEAKIPKTEIRVDLPKEDKQKADAPEKKDQLEKHEQVQEAEGDKLAERASDNKTAEENQDDEAGTTKVEGDSPLTASEEQPGTKEAKIPKTEIREDLPKEDKKNGRKETKQAKKVPEKELSITDVLKGLPKVKRVANSSGDEAKTDRPNDNNNRNAKASSRVSALGGCNRAPQSNTGNGNGDDDDDERRRPRPSDPSKKRPGCDQQAPKKKTQKKHSRGSRSPSSIPSSPEAMVWEPTGNLGKNDGSSLKAPPVSQLEQKLWKQMHALSLGNQHREGPAGDAGHNKHLAAFLSEELSRPEEPMPRTCQNRRAARRWLLDNGFQAHRVALSLPSHMQERGPSARQDPHALPSLGINPRAGASREVPVAGGLAVEAPIADEALQPPEGAPGVRRGGPRDVRVLAERVGRLRGLDPAELRGRHEGVLLNEDLTPMNGQYREGQEYTKLRCIGKGAFGDVFLIQDRATCKRVVGKRVAVKDFVPSEATLWCELDHPGIVRFLGLLITDDCVVFLSSYQPGSRTLQELIDQSVLGQGQAVLITRQLVLALEYLHIRHRIVHKDIKPHNILVLPGDRVQLIDFGLAYQLTTSEHRDEALKGTDCYMAPEIAVSGPYDARVDIWSAACTLICMISGHPPWAQRFNGVRVKIFIIGNNPPPLEDIPSNTDPRVRHFLEQTLKKDFQERPTATQALEILSHIPAEELYNTLAIECEDPEPEPMNIPNELPDDAFADPLTPWTPRGPDFRPFQRPSPQPRQPPQDMSLSGLLIPRDEEPRKDQQVEEEDMYGPPAVQNNWATSSFMLDSANHPSGLSEESNSFELPSSSARSMEECHSWQTAHDIMFKGGEMLSAEDPPQDEPDVGGAVGVVAGTSGVLSTSPGHSGDETSLTDTIQSTSTAVSGGIVAAVSIEGLEPLRMKLRPDFDARELLQVIKELPDFQNTKLASKTIKLCWKDTGEVLELDHTFGRGEHQLHVVAMEAPGEGYWPMDIDG